MARVLAILRQEATVHCAKNSPKRFLILNTTIWPVLVQVWQTSFDHFRRNYKVSVF